MADESDKARFGAFARGSWKFFALTVTTLFVGPLWLGNASVQLIEFVLIFLVCASWCFQSRIADELNERIEHLQKTLDTLLAESRGA